MVQKRFCDGCGKEIAESESRGLIEFGGYKNSEEDYESETEKEFCKKCYNELKRLFKRH